MLVGTIYLSITILVISLNFFLNKALRQRIYFDVVRDNISRDFKFEVANTMFKFTSQRKKESRPILSNQALSNFPLTSLSQQSNSFSSLLERIDECSFNYRTNYNIQFDLNIDPHLHLKTYPANFNHYLYRIYKQIILELFNEPTLKFIRIDMTFHEHQFYLQFEYDIRDKKILTFKDQRILKSAEELGASVENLNHCISFLVPM